jgi:ribosome-binding factor A
MGRRDARLIELIAHEAAMFIEHEASGQSLITVTRATLSKNAERATVFVSIFPESEQRPALSFLERVVPDFRKHLATNTHLYPLPQIKFVFDEGEIHRRHLDEISKKA